MICNQWPPIDTAPDNEPVLVITGRYRSVAIKLNGAWFAWDELTGRGSPIYKPAGWHPLPALPYEIEDEEARP